METSLEAKAHLAARNDAYQKKWRASEKCRRYQRKYQREYKRKIRLTEQGRKTDRAIFAKYAKSPKGKAALRAARQRYRKTPLGVLSVRSDYQRRRALKLSASTDSRHAMKAWLGRMIELARLDCYWCRENVPRSKRTHDHVIALSKGGANTVANSCMACGPCNYSKGAKDPMEWAGQGYFRL